MSQSRPKPWESSNETTSTGNTATINTIVNSPGSATGRPSVPPIPSSIVNNAISAAHDHSHSHDDHSAHDHDASGNGSSTTTTTATSNLGHSATSYGASIYGNNTYGSGYGSSYGGAYGSTYGSGLSGYGSTYGSGLGGYGGYGGLNNYSSGLGSYGSYGGYGGYGSYGMGGMGGMRGMSRYGQMGGYGGYGGMPGVSENGNGTLNGVADATAQTFQVLENVVYAVGAVAALLESTYYATHNSFFTILGVADQLGNLGSIGGAIKDTVGGITGSAKMIGDAAANASSNSSSTGSGPLGLFALLSWLKKILKKLLGFSTESSSVSGSHSLIQEFSNWKNVLSGSSSSAKIKNTSKNGKGKLSLKPLLVFLVALVGLPMIMSKFVRYIEGEQQKRRTNGTLSNINSMNLQNTGSITEVSTVSSQQPKLDPRSLEFARAIYDYIPETETEQANGWKELKLLRGNLVAILASIDGWSHCRARDGRMGYVPTDYLEIVKRVSKTTPAPALDNSTLGATKPVIVEKNI